MTDLIRPGVDPGPEPDPLDAAVAAFRALPVPPVPADAPLVARLTAAGASPAAHPPARSRRRLLMRVAVLSAAASLAVAAGVFLVAAPRAVALADVIRAAEVHHLVKYRKVQQTAFAEHPLVSPLVSISYADLHRPRYRIVFRDPRSLSGAIDHETVWLIDGTKGVEARRITAVESEASRTDPRAAEQLAFWKQAGGKLPRREMAIGNFGGDRDRVDLTPATADRTKSILENLRGLEAHKAAVATRSKLGSIDALRFRVVDGERTTVLWVDPSTHLPLRLEYDTTDPADLHPTSTSTKYILSDFEWDPQLEGFRDLDDLFSTEPPPGYTVEDQRTGASPAKK